MNFFAGKVVRSTPNATEIEVEGLGLQRVDAAVSRHSVGALVVIAIRPEKLMLSFEPRAGAQNSVAGSLQATSYLGERRLFFAEIEGKSAPVAISTQNHSHALPQDFKAGRAIWLSWGHDAFGVLDHE
jgi:putrescine transport system ATP-binding protein